MNNITELAIMISAILAAVGAMGLAAKWLIRSAVRPLLIKGDAAADLIKAQLVRNGGNTLLDQISLIPTHHEDNVRRFDEVNLTLRDLVGEQEYAKSQRTQIATDLSNETLKASKHRDEILHRVEKVEMELERVVDRLDDNS